PGFKRIWAALVSPPVERSTYVLSCNVVLILLMLIWQPLPGIIWDFGRAGEGPCFFVAVIGLAILVVASFQMDHWELTGLRQVWDFAKRRTPRDVPFKTPGLYRRVRHPLMSGLLLAIWATSYLTVGRLLFNAGLTLYILLALRWEERDLLARFGSAYADYRRR